MYTDYIVHLLLTVYTLVAPCLVPAPGWAQDGAVIAAAAELFSARFRTEFQEMNDLFAEFGFEIEVIEGEQPTLGAITAKYGASDRLDDVDVVLGYGASERPATLTFYYYNDVGFGVLPDDAEQLVLMVKRREG